MEERSDAKLPQENPPTDGTPYLSWRGGRVGLHVRGQPQPDFTISYSTIMESHRKCAGGILRAASVRLRRSSDGAETLVALDETIRELLRLAIEALCPKLEQQPDIGCVWVVGAGRTIRRYPHGEVWISPDRPLALSP